MIFKIGAYTCGHCGRILYSRAHHDFRFCLCEKSAVDGGLFIENSEKNPGYVRVTGPMTPVYYDFEFSGTEDELRKLMYEDWNKSKDKYGLVEC